MNVTVLLPAVNVPLFVQLPPTLMACATLPTDVRLFVPVALIVRFPVTVSVCAAVLSPAAHLPRFTVTATPGDAVPMFSVAAVVVNGEPNAVFPILIVLAAVTVVPRFNVLNVVPELPVIYTGVVVPSNVTVPELFVNVPELLQFPPTFSVVLGAVTVPFVIVKLLVTSAAFAPNDHAPPTPLNVRL